MRLLDPSTGAVVWDSADPYSGPVPPPPEGRKWVQDMGPPVRGPERQAQPNGLDYYLGGTGIPNRLAMMNQMFNPVEAIGGSMAASERMFAPQTDGWGRVAAAGDMLSGVAGVVAPAVMASRVGGPAVNALADTFTGLSTGPRANALAGFAADEFGGISVPGFRAFHGSPHDFDKFSMDKIGTGEGAQAYGHGLYFAEKEAVAQGYQTNNSASAVMKYNGKPITDETKKSVAWYLDQNNGDKEAVLRQWRGMYNPRYWESPLGKREVKALEAMDYSKLKAGNMYEVQINANPDDFLDWDKPITEQPKAVQDLARDMDLSGAKGATKGMIQAWRDGRDVGALPSGADIDRALSAYGDNRPAATEALKSAGVKGVKYFDAGSRGAGDGSRNFVVFDENLISIVKKYGIAGAAALLGVSAADVEQAMAQTNERRP